MSRWDEAYWGVDRWAFFSIPDLLQQPPDVERGVPTGLDDWRLSTEILLPADQQSLWGVGLWGVLPEGDGESGDVLIAYVDDDQSYLAVYDADGTHTKTGGDALHVTLGWDGILFLDFTDYPGDPVVSVGFWVFFDADTMFSAALGRSDFQATVGTGGASLYTAGWHFVTLEGLEVPDGQHVSMYVSSSSFTPSELWLDDFYFVPYATLAQGLDVAQWNTYSWRDLTPWVRGEQWTRGADEPFGRARVGDMTVTLDNEDGRWSPWNPTPPDSSVAYFAPGTIVRTGIRSATDQRAGGWLPQFTGIVDAWSEEYVDATLAGRFVEVTVVETLRDLAGIDENALPGVVGGGEGPMARLVRLLEAAGWRYGFRVEAQNVLAAPGFYALQSTDMAANRIAECYQTADSCDAHFRTDRTGCAVLTNVEYIGNVGVADPELVRLSEFSWFGANRLPVLIFSAGDPGRVDDLWYVQYDPASFQSRSNDRNVVNIARFARVGGSQQVYQQNASVTRHGERTLPRSDFLNTDDAPVAQLAQYTTIRRGLNTLRVDGLDVQVIDRGSEPGLAVLAADVGDFVNVFPPETYDPNPNIAGFIRSMTHRVTPRNTGEVSWEVTFAFDTRVVHDLPGAQLPETV